MTQEYLDPGGIVVPESSLTCRRAIELVATLRGPGDSFATLVECRSTSAADTVIFDVDVERPQLAANGIQRVERLAAVFSRNDETYPEALALRPDFKATVHLNQRLEEFPRSLCLYDRSWAEVRITWTAATFLDRVRWWLRETARDSLHGEGQALEAFVVSWGHWLVLPPVPEDGEPPVAFAVTLPGGPEGRVFVANEANGRDRRPQGAKSVVLRFSAPPRRHGVVPRMPRNLADLSDLLRAPDFELLAAIRSSLRSWPQENEPLLGHFVIILVDLPKTRHTGGEIEAVEHLAFLTCKSVMDLGLGVGVWTVWEKKRSMLLAFDESRNGKDISVSVLNVCHAFTRRMAARLNGLEGEVNLKIVAVGAGAIGSQVAMNLARAGWGKWTIIDEDDLLPHNLARHALDGPLVGHAKAKALAFSMNCLFMDPGVASGISADVLRPGTNAETVRSAIEGAEVLLDLSASVAVARELAAARSPARRVSLFLSPSGQDLVLLAEDRTRQIALDHLEMTYYAAVATQACLEGHLDVDSGLVRYGLSCRDVSSRIPQDAVGMFSGMGARAIRQAIDVEGASIRVWRVQSDSLGVVPVSIVPEHFVSEQRGEWTILIASSVLRSITAFRESRLPRETGGVIVGAVDHDRKTLYLVLASASPSDSVERSQCFIRGCHQLRSEVERIQRRTAENLCYVGEWHSHPSGSGTLPSQADVKLFAWIAEHALAEGKPPVMLIVGDQGRCRLVVGSSDSAGVGKELCL